MPDSPLSGALEFAKMLAAGGLRLDPVDSAPSIEDLRLLAKKRLPTMAFDIIDGASNHEITLDANVRDLREVRFRPRSASGTSRTRSRATTPSPTRSSWRSTSRTSPSPGRTLQR